MAKVIKIVCAHCGKFASKDVGRVNDARKHGRRLFCNTRCFGLARRVHKTKAQKVSEKRAYDKNYRKKNLAMLKVKKHAYFKRTYNPVKAAIERKKRMKLHIEYCRRPEYKKYKSKYDAKRRAKNPRARLGLPQWTPEPLVQSIQLLQTIRKEQKREHKRA